MCAGAARHVSLAVPRRVCVTVDNLARLMRTLLTLLTGVRFPAARIDAAAAWCESKSPCKRNSAFTFRRGPDSCRTEATPRPTAARRQQRAPRGAARRWRLEPTGGPACRSDAHDSHGAHPTETRPARARARAADCTRIAPRLQSNRRNVPWPDRTRHCAMYRGPYNRGAGTSLFRRPVRHATRHGPFEHVVPSALPPPTLESCTAAFLFPHSDH